MWSETDEGDLRAAMWRDSFGKNGEIVLPKRLIERMSKPDSIRAVRDITLNDFRPRLSRAILECGEPLPRWLSDAANVMHLWKSPSRFHELIHKWRVEKCDVARAAYEMLDAWWLRDGHLWDYEAGVRGDSLRCRREIYRLLAAKWSRQYRYVIVPDRDLSREARWGSESDRRFRAAPQELRGALKHAFGDGYTEVAWRGPHGVHEDSELTWLEYAIEQERAIEMAAAARDAKKHSESKDVKGGAWARRKAKKSEKMKSEENRSQSDVQSGAK
jgi:hypothetical protein